MKRIQLLHVGGGGAVQPSAGCNFCARPERILYWEEARVQLGSIADWQIDSMLWTPPKEVRVGECHCGLSAPVRRQQQCDAMDCSHVLVRPQAS